MDHDEVKGFYFTIKQKRFMLNIKQSGNFQTVTIWAFVSEMYALFFKFSDMINIQTQWCFR